MTKQIVIKNIHKYILDNFLFTDDESELNVNDSFTENGVIDSTGVIELVSFVEENYKFSVEDDEINRVNFDSVEKLASFVMEKLK